VNVADDPQDTTCTLAGIPTNACTFAGGLSASAVCDPEIETADGGWEKEPA